MKSVKDYHPEIYWTEVGKKIKSRKETDNVIAGDDEPYYRYKREQFLNLLKEVDFNQKSVLEIGCGPGGNLVELSNLKPRKLVGVDISDQMVELAQSKKLPNVEILKVNGTRLPFADKTFDIVFSATVLQHNTDEPMLSALIQEMCRVSAKQVFLFERIETEITGDELCLGRPVSYYESFMNRHGFSLAAQKFINIRVSYYWAGMIRKGLNSSSRQEGEPLNWISTTLQSVFLPITKILDKLFTSEKDIAKLEFKRR
jgi:ubiquinone/menaquinone biosynthesis C-methylase UbiE